MKTALIVVDGVLRKLTGDAPIPEGVRLYRALSRVGRVILLSDDHTPQTTEWLELNGCGSHDFIMVTTPGMAWVEPANDMRREGYDIDLAIVPDPGHAQYFINAGFNTLLFTHSIFALPEWRPDTDKGVRPWDDIKQQVADLARKKAADARLKDSDG